jgi:hypothetical protein
MTDNYLLTELFKKTTAMRKAQKEYYAFKKPFDDPMKKSYLQEAQRREQDVDRLIVTIVTARPELNPKIAGL